MNLVEFYKKLLPSFGITVKDNGGLFVKVDGVEMPINIDGIPCFLPTKENISTAVEMVDGKLELVKYIFNPLKEDPIKKVSPAFLKLKQAAELRAVKSLNRIGEELIRQNLSGDENDNIELLKFTKILADYKKSRIKKLIDEETLDKWIGLYAKSLENFDQYPYLRFNFKRGGTINNIKYNRVGTITYPFLEKALSIKIKTETLMGIRLRNKDLHFIEAVFRFLYGDDVPTPKQFPSNDKISPTMHALVLIWEFIYKQHNRVTDALRGSLSEVSLEEMWIEEFGFDVSNFSNIIESLKPEIMAVPDPEELKANKQPQQSMPQQQTTTQQTSSGGSFWDRVDSKPQQPQQPVTQQTVVQQPMVQNPYIQQPYVPPVTQPMMEQDPWAAPSVQPMMQQPPVTTQPPSPSVFSNPIDPWSL